MGLDLKVFASHFRERRGEMLPTATVRFDRDSAIFSQLTAEATPCLVYPLPDGLSVGFYGDDGLRYTRVDQFHNPLTFTTPSELKRLTVPHDAAPWNRAILTFLLALPPDTRLVLYWC